MYTCRKTVSGKSGTGPLAPNFRGVGVWFHQRLRGPVLLLPPLLGGRGDRGGLIKFLSLGLCLGSLATDTPAVAQSADAQVTNSQTTTASFETFAVPNPTPGSASGAGMPRPASGAPAYSPPAPKERLDALVGLTLFPGATDLGLDVSGRMNGRTIQSQTSAARWMRGDWSDAGFLQVARGGQNFQLGQSGSDLLGSAEGVRLSSGPADSSRPTLGLGLYRRLGATQTGGVVAADSQWHLSHQATLGMLLAADSSWRAVQQAEGRNWQVSSFLGRDARTSRAEGGLLVEARPVRQASLYGRVDGWSGAQPGRNWSLGATRWVGPAFLAMDYSRFQSPGSATREMNTSLLVPMRRGALTLRWQDGADEFSNGDGILGRQGTRSLLTNLTFAPDAGTTLWAGGGPAWQRGGRPQIALTFGGQRSLGRLWELEAEVSQIDSVRRNAHLSLGYRFDGADEVKLLFGPTSVFSPDGAQRHAFGLAVAHDFRWTPDAAGAVGGQVLIDGRPAGPGRLVRLDGGQTARTDGAGRFSIAHVPPGSHMVGMDLADLPADLSADLSPVVTVAVGKTTPVTLSLRRVGQVRGVVRVGADAFGQTDCAAGVGITLSAGDVQTTTDADDAFVLGGLPPGRCRLSLAKETIPPDFDVIGPDAVDVDVTPNGRVPTVQFTIAPHHPQIAFCDDGAPALTPPIAVPRPASSAPAPSAIARVAPAVPPARVAARPEPAPAAWPHGMLAKGAVAPDFALAGVDGKTVSLSSLRGRVVVLNFWSSWCGSPQRDLPQLEALGKRLGSRGLTVLSVNSWDDRAAMTAFLTTHHLDTTGHVCDPSVSNASVAVRLYNVPDVPAVYVIDRDGKIAAASVGDSRAAMDGLQNALAALGIS